MAGIAACLSTADSAHVVERMLDVMQHRGTLRTVSSRPEISLGWIGRQGHGGEHSVGDTLLICDGPTNAGPAAVDLHEWEPGSVTQWAGESAAIAWNGASRTLVAARDPFGARPLYYATHGDRLLLASEVEALLAVLPVQEPDDDVVLDYLRGALLHPRQTFFRGISRVPPGHYLVAKEGAISATRYFFASASESGPRDPVEAALGFAAELRRSVCERLKFADSIVAELSGGLDSSSIVCLANDCLREEAQPPKLHTLSLVFPGLPCDETPFIDAVTRHVAFPSIRFDATRVGPELESTPMRAWPLLHPQPVFLAAAGEAALQTGAQVLLSGEGGDHLLTEFGVFRDLFVHGRWPELYRQLRLARGYSRRSMRSWLHYSGVFPSNPFRPRRQAPSWVGPRLRKRWLEPPRLESSPLSSHVATLSWQALVDPDFYGGIGGLEYIEASLARLGIQPRFPFLDAGLARYVLSIPWEARMPEDLSKMLLRRGLSHVLPPTIAKRGHKAVFDANVVAYGRRLLPWVREVIGTGHWLSAPYVDRRSAGNLLQCLMNDLEGPGNLDRWLLSCKIVRLEVWLRKTIGA